MQRVVLDVVAAQTQNANINAKALLVMTIMAMALALIALRRMLRPFREVLGVLAAGMLVVLLLAAACVLGISALVMSA